MTKFIRILAAAALTLGLVATASAHHSMAGFDRTKDITISGTIKQFKWANPHCWVEVEGEGPNGKLAVWNFEMTAPSFLVRAGWKRTSLNPGDKVSITGHPMLNGDPGALFVSVKLPDGKVLTERAQPAAAGTAKE